MEIIRGDNKTFKFQRKDQNGNVILTKPDEVYFTVKKCCAMEAALIQKTLKSETISFDAVSGWYSFELLPKDTDNLTYGEYGFDIEIIVGNKKKTILVDTLVVKEEVTHACNEI